MAKTKLLNAQATGTYGIEAWDEKTWDGKDRKAQPGVKLTHAKIRQDFHGDIEGSAEIQLVMSYREDESATFVGLQYMSGRIGERIGTFVIKVDGMFEKGVAKSTWEIISGSGTGDLRGIRGEGTTEATHGDRQPFTLNYRFE